MGLFFINWSLSDPTTALSPHLTWHSCGTHALRNYFTHCAECAKSYAFFCIHLMGSLWSTKYTPWRIWKNIYVYSWYFWTMHIFNQSYLCWILTNFVIILCSNSNFDFSVIIIIIIINPLTARVIGAPQMILQPVFCIFCSPLPSWTCQTPGLSIPWCCLPTSSSVCLVFFLFHCAVQGGFGQTWWTGDLTYHCSLHLFTIFRRSLCGPIAYWHRLPRW